MRPDGSDKRPLVTKLRLCSDGLQSVTGRAMADLHRIQRSARRGVGRGRGWAERSLSRPGRQHRVVGYALTQDRYKPFGMLVVPVGSTAGKRRQGINAGPVKQKRRQINAGRRVTFWPIRTLRC